MFGKFVASEKCFSRGKCGSTSRWPSGGGWHQGAADFAMSPKFQAPFVQVEGACSQSVGSVVEGCLFYGDLCTVCEVIFRFRSHLSDIFDSCLASCSRVLSKKLLLFVRRRCHRRPVGVGSTHRGLRVVSTCRGLSSPNTINGPAGFLLTSFFLSKGSTSPVV